MNEVFIRPIFRNHPSENSMASNSGYLKAILKHQSNLFLLAIMRVF